LYEAVTDYVRNNFQRAEAAENRNVGLALTVLQRRLASSMAAIRLSLGRRLKRLRDLQKLGKLKQEYGDLPEDLDDLVESERWHFEDELVERLTMAGTMAELETEIEDLNGSSISPGPTRRASPRPSSRNSAASFPSISRGATSGCWSSPNIKTRSISWFAS